MTPKKRQCRLALLDQDFVEGDDEVSDSSFGRRTLEGAKELTSLSPQLDPAYPRTDSSRKAFLMFERGRLAVLKTKATSTLQCLPQHCLAAQC